MGTMNFGGLVIEFDSDTPLSDIEEIVNRHNAGYLDLKIQYGYYEGIGITLSDLSEDYYTALEDKLFKDSLVVEESVSSGLSALIDDCYEIGGIPKEYKNWTSSTLSKEEFINRLLGEYF